MRCGRIWSILVLWLDLCCQTYLKDPYVAVLSPWQGSLPCDAVLPNPQPEKNLNLNICGLFMIYISRSWRKCFVPYICMWPRVRWILPFHLYVTRGRWFSHQNWAKSVSMLYVQFLHFWIVMDTNGKGDRENTKNICKLLRDFTCGKPGRQLWSF